MFKLREIVVVVLVALIVCPVDAFARGGRGGGGRGGGGRSMGGGGGYRGGGGYGSGSMNRAPSMSRPSMPSQSRPSQSRPSASRPSSGARPSTGAIGSQPGIGARPSAGGRPNAGNMAGSRPTAGQLNSFLNLPSQGARPGAGGGRPSAGNLPAGGNAAVADFFQHGGGAVAGATTGAIAGNRAGQVADRAQGATRDRAGQVRDRAGAAGEDRAGAQNRLGSEGQIADNRADRINDRTEGRSDLRDSRGENRDFASDNRQDRVSDRGDRQSARVENRGDYRASLAEGRGDRRTDRQQQRGERADSIRDAISNEFDENHLFEDFWREHPQAYVNFHQNPVFWSWAAWNTVAAFMPWNWGSGYYYDYGSGGSSGYSSDTGTMYTDEATYSSPEYCEEAQALAESAPEEPPADAQWMPLGVFAMTADDNSSTSTPPNMFLQLAVSQEGIIAGTYQNKTTGKTASLEGMVDKESQRAAWTISGKNTPIMETGLQNLTMNETQALVHFADGTTQRWLLVRIENPNAAQQAAGTTAPPAPAQPVAQ